jgi:hypothetical protein
VTPPLQRPRRPLEPAGRDSRLGVLPGRADSAADSARESDGQSVSSGASSPGSSHSRPGVASACDDVCGLMVARWARAVQAPGPAAADRSVSRPGGPAGPTGPGDSPLQPRAWSRFPGRRRRLGPEYD